jgi:hypothetical protein
MVFPSLKALEVSLNLMPSPALPAPAPQLNTRHSAPNTALQRCFSRSGCFAVSLNLSDLGRQI